MADGCIYQCLAADSCEIWSETRRISLLGLFYTPDPRKRLLLPNIHAESFPAIAASRYRDSQVRQ